MGHKPFYVLEFSADLLHRYMSLKIKNRIFAKTTVLPPPLPLPPTRPSAAPIGSLLTLLTKLTSLTETTITALHFYYAQ